MNNVTEVLQFYLKVPTHLETSPIINVWRCQFKRVTSYNIEQVNVITRTPYGAYARQPSMQCNVHGCLHMPNNRQSSLVWQQQ